MPPVQRTTSLDPVNFHDFSPGIAHNPGVNYPVEQATDASFRCIANRNGALVPLPARTIPFSMPHVAADGATQIGVTGLYTPPIPLLPTVLAFQPASYPEHELFVGIEWVEGGNRHHRLYRVRRYETPATLFDLLQNRSFADASGPPLVPNGMGFGTTRSNSADPTHTGTPIVVAMWGFGVNRGYLLSFPNDTTPTSNTTYLAYDDTNFLMGLCCHQGRTVIQIATGYGHGTDTITFMGENVQWSRVNNFHDWTPNTDPDVAVNVFPQAWVEENPSGLAFMVAMSANELFAVKTHGGLYVSGDLDNPNVVSLPMVTGSELSHTPVATDIGVVYGNRSSGVWVWPHGDTSTLLSPTMTPDFWVITPGTDLDQFGGIGYQFARCDEWVLVSNNWIFDTRLKSWWRLEDPDIMQCRYMTSLNHFIYGTDSFYDASDPTNGSDQPVALWKREDKTSSYQWQSHPIWQSVADIVNVAQIEMVAEGKGSITLSLTVLDGTTNSITLDLDDLGRPERFRENFSMQGKYMQLTIQADSGDDISPAPTVYSVSLEPFSESPIGHTV